MPERALIVSIEEIQAELQVLVFQDFFFFFFFFFILWPIVLVGYLLQGIWCPVEILEIRDVDVGWSLSISGADNIF